MLLKKNQTDIIDVSHELKGEIQEAGQIASNMRGSVKNLVDVPNIMTTISILGATAGQLADPHIKPLISAISTICGGAGLLCKTETLQKVLENVITYNKSDHVLYLYNNFDKFPINPKKDRLKILKSKKIFNDKLSKKYEYYDQIYENIPIMRVIIDMTSRLIVGKGGKLSYDWDDKIPNHKLKEEIEEWFTENFSKVTLILQTKQQLLYGKSYYIRSIVKKGRKKTSKLKLINPKYIRPHKKGYILINEKGREELLKKDEIVEFYNPERNTSLIEKYIYLLDEIYPEITNKGNRPKLLYDILLENLEKGWKLNDLQESKNLYLEALKIAIMLENRVYAATTLTALGDLHKKHNCNIEALEYYESAQDFLEGKMYSVSMEELDKILIKAILETEKLL